MLRAVLIGIHLCLLVLQWSAEAWAGEAAAAQRGGNESQFFLWWKKKPPAPAVSKTGPEAAPVAAEKPPEFAVSAALAPASNLPPSAASSSPVKPWKPNLLHHAGGALNKGQRSMRKYTLCPVCLIAATGLKFYGKDALGPNSPGQSLICVTTGVLDFVCRKILSDLVASQIQYVEPHESCRAIGFCLRVDDKGNPYPAGKDMPSLLPLKEAKLRAKEKPPAPNQPVTPNAGQPPIQPSSARNDFIGVVTHPPVVVGNNKDEDEEFPPASASDDEAEGDGEERDDIDDKEDDKEDVE